MTITKKQNIHNGVEVDKRIPEEMFVQLLAEKANFIKDHL